MPWFKVDDHLHASVKARRAGKAMALWVLAGSWCAQQLTDGFVPDDMLPSLGGADWEQDSVTLLRVGLWTRMSRRDETGYQFHDWADYQPSKEDVLADREATRERQRRWRQNRKKKPGNAVTQPSTNDVTPHVTDAVADAVTNDAPSPPLPTPSLRSGGVGGDADESVALQPISEEVDRNGPAWTVGDERRRLAAEARNNIRRAPTPVRRPDNAMERLRTATSDSVAEPTERDAP